MLTDETVCTFNSMLIFRDLFNNKCKLLDNSLENLYYIADRIIECDDSEQYNYFTINVTTIPNNAICKINGNVVKSAILRENTVCQIEVTLNGYNSYTNSFVVTKDENILVELNPQEQFYNLTVNAVDSYNNNSIENSIINFSTV